MSEPIRRVLARLYADHAENRPSSPRETLLYCIEVWAAVGLFWRVVCHTVLYSARHAGADIHPLTVEYGLTAGLHVEADAQGRTPTPEDARVIQSTTTVVSAIIVAAILAGGVMAPAWVLIVFAPSLAITAGDALLGVAHDINEVR